MCYPYREVEGYKNDKDVPPEGNSENIHFVTLLLSWFGIIKELFSFYHFNKICQNL